MYKIGQKNEQEVRFANEDLPRVASRKKGIGRFAISFVFSAILAGVSSLLPMFTIVGQSGLAPSAALWCNIAVLAASLIATTLEFVAVVFDTKANDKTVREQYERGLTLGKYYPADIVVKGPTFASVTKKYFDDIKLACIFFRVACFLGAGIGVLFFGARGTLIAWLTWAGLTGLIIAITISSYSEDFLKSLPEDDVPDYLELGINPDDYEPSRFDNSYVIRIREERRREAAKTNPGLREILLGKKGGG